MRRDLLVDMNYKRIMHLSVAIPGGTGTAHRFQLHLQNGGGATNPVGVPPGILLRKCKSNPIPSSRKINKQS